MNRKTIIEAILNSSRPNETANVWRGEIDNEIAILANLSDELGQYVRFASASEPTYAISDDVAEWLRLAMPPEHYQDHHPELLNVSVTKVDGKAYAVMTDGIRLHAHAVDGIPCGVYCIADNMLRLAPSQEYQDWKKIMPVDPIPMNVDYHLLVDSDEFGLMIATWNVVGNIMATPATREDANYGIDIEYLSDAWTISIDEPTYAKNADGTKPLLLRWPEAFALIMPVKPEAYRGGEEQTPEDE